MHQGRSRPHRTRFFEHLRPSDKSCRRRLQSTDKWSSICSRARPLDFCNPSSAENQTNPIVPRVMDWQDSDDSSAEPPAKLVWQLRSKTQKARGIAPEVTVLQQWHPQTGESIRKRARMLS